ncbi:Pentatricopeptide repeat superfamily protein [Rhynchospora pubera]|uniref:Pentatricopeptide repeat superfamily protein n=1 Tax=Rhynchospora pubera TaxID=906938 RepID=A0AAV8FW75_9POAL|nr:Pentatricopeptide repeat superfamily protein [Rhynchospora pubera]
MEAMALSFTFSGIPPLRTTSTLSSKFCISCALAKTLDKPLFSAPTNSTSNAPLNSAQSNSTHKPFKIARRDPIDGIKTASDLESALQRAEGILQVEDYNIVLRYFCESKKWSHLSQLFEWMQAHNEFNVGSYSTYFKYMGLSRNPVKALKAYDNIKDAEIKLHPSVCNSILGCLVRNGRTESALKLFDQMKSDGLLPNLVTYSTLLTGCSKLKNGYATAMELLKEIKAQNLGMDSVIYGTLLAICASNNRREEAELYFQQMKNEGHSPNLFHYSSLLNVYAEDRDHTKAQMLINDMKSVGIAPNKVVLTTLLKVYAKGGLFEKSKELLAELETLGYAQDEIAYAILIDNLAKQGKLDEAKKIFADMNEKGVKSDGYSYMIMISALCRSRLLEEAKQLAKEYESKYAKYDDVVILNTLLRAYCNNGDMESVMQMLKRMDEVSISPDWNTFHILIKYFSKEKLYHLAYKTINNYN